MNMTSIMNRVRMLALLKGDFERKRERKVGFSGVARKAMLKSRGEMGDEGVTMTAGKGDFSATSGSDRSKKD